MKEHDKIAQLRPVTPDQLLKKRNLITRFNSKVKVNNIEQKEQDRLQKRYEKLPNALKKQKFSPNLQNLQKLELRAEKVKDIQKRVVRLRRRFPKITETLPKKTLSRCKTCKLGLVN